MMDRTRTHLISITYFFSKNQIISSSQLNQMVCTLRIIRGFLKILFFIELKPLSFVSLV